MIDRSSDAGYEFLGGSMVDGEGGSGQLEWADPIESDSDRFDCLGAGDDSGPESEESTSSSESSEDSDDVRGTGHRCPGGA